jgi:hypothetical protein
MIQPQNLSSRLWTPLTWIAVVGIAAISSNYPELRSIAPGGSALGRGLDVLEVGFIALFWLVVGGAAFDGIRRWSGDTVRVRIETTILVIATAALAGTTALNLATFSSGLGVLPVLWLPVPYVFHAAALTAIFGVAALCTVFMQSERVITFEAITVPALALIFPFALTGLGMGHATADTIAFWALAASAAVVGIAFVATRDRIHIALLAGIGGACLTPPITLIAVLVPTVALFVPLLRHRAQSAFVVGADRIALFGAGLGLAGCFGASQIVMLSPTLRSQMEHADFVLAMRSWPMIMAACLALFALCVLTSPLVAFSLLTAAYMMPIIGTMAYEAQCSVIGGSVPIAIAALIARAEWQRSTDDAWQQRANLAAAAILLVVGWICAMIPHPPYFSV